MNNASSSSNQSTPTQSRGSLSSRRSFLAGAGAAALGASIFANVPLALAQSPLPTGDEAILRFLAAAEILETDLWQQYNELGGIQDSEVPGRQRQPGVHGGAGVLDSDMAQYIHDNTEDEFTHFTFLNAYLRARGGRAGRSRTRSARCRAARRPARSRSSGSRT